MDGIIEFVLTGVASVEEIVSLLERLDELARDEPGLHVLIDQSDLEPVGITTDDLRRIADAWRDLKHIREARIAVLAPSEVVYGLNRQALAFADGTAAKALFRTRAEAEDWLRL